MYFIDGEEKTMKDLNYLCIAEDVLTRIKQGAFLTVKTRSVQNTMTIGWVTFGFIWQKPVMMVAVRSTRHTFDLMEKARDFTVTVPSGDMGKILAVCGSKSGRDVDKFALCKLATADGHHVVSPIINVAGIHYECKIVYASAMNPARLDENYDKTLYPKKDYHTLYFGEILACYETD
jgi:flavin reductase (DIM6/NTAB) family NADH-FMN oxidoreductase RutF